MLEVRNISKHFREFSLDDVSFSLDQGDYFVLLGLSGAGKSMILELIAGLMFPDQGKILLHGKDITLTKIQQRNISLVFQDLALFPHLTVKNNILYPVKAKKIASARTEKNFRELTGLLEIGSLLHRKPETLSGGERQRVALARALICEPDIVLLDEPLASIDIQLKDNIRSLLRKINRQGRTILHVTHDFQEAVSLATQIAVLQDGRLVQQGDPQSVFGQPRSAFIARLSGRKNYFEILEVTGHAGGYRQLRLSGSFTLNYAGNETPGPALLIESSKVSFAVTETASADPQSYPGEITEVIPALYETEYKVDIGLALSVTAGRSDEIRPAAGEKVRVIIPSEAITFIRPS